MSEKITKQPTNDTETTSMNAWVALGNADKSGYVATGVPVADPSSQPNDSCSFEALKRLTHSG
jgi:hypothetical protein